MYLDLTSYCEECGCCGLRFKDNNDSEYAAQNHYYGDPRIATPIDFSIEIWVYPSSTGANLQGVVTNIPSPNALGFWALVINAGRFEFICGANTHLAATFSQRIARFSSPILLNKWYHIVANRISHNPVYWELYVNGEKQDAGGINWNPNYPHDPTLSAPAVFGRFQGLSEDAYFSGVLAQARFYTRPLAHAEVLYNFKHGFWRPFSLKDLYFWAPFNYCQGLRAEALTSSQNGAPNPIWLHNFGGRTLAGGGAWGKYCTQGEKNIGICQESLQCNPYQEDILPISLCDSLAFPSYVKNNPLLSISVENHLNYNLYLACVRQYDKELVFDWRRKIFNDWGNTPNNLQTVQFHLDFSLHQPRILNLTVHHYECNEIIKTWDLEEKIPCPSPATLLNAFLHFLENNVFPGAQTAVFASPEGEGKFIVHLSVPPDISICNKDFLLLSNPGALRPGQVLPPPCGANDAMPVKRCTTISFQNIPLNSFCTSSLPSSGTPPSMLCQDQESGEIPFVFATNELSLTTLGQCLVINTPGNYELDYKIILEIDQAFAWIYTNCLRGKVEVVISLILLDQTLPLYSYTYEKNDAPVNPCSNGAVFWNPVNNTESSSNPSGVLSFIQPTTNITVTAAMIAAQQNRICLAAQIKTEAQISCGECDSNVQQFCCDGIWGDLDTRNLTPPFWAPGVQGGGSWFSVTDNTANSSPAFAVAASTCFPLSLSPNCDNLQLGITIENGRILFSQPGVYNVTLTLEYHKFFQILWENTNCVTGQGVIILFQDVFGVQTVLDDYTFNIINQNVPCTMTTPITGPIPFNIPNPGPGQTFTINFPVNYTGGPNNALCIGTSAQISANYTCTNCYSGGGQTQNCREINFASYNPLLSACDIESTPPSYIFQDCESQDTRNAIFSSVGINTPTFYYNPINGCLEILTPGSYTITLTNIIATIIAQGNDFNAKGWQTQHAAYVNIKIPSHPPILINGITFTSLFGGNNCNTPQNNTYVNPPYSNTFTFTLTAAQIAANQNRICVEVHTYARVVNATGYCNLTQPANVSALTEVKLQGNLRICENEPITPLQGSVTVRIANFLKGTVSICKNADLGSRIIEAWGEVMAKGELSLCQTEIVPFNCVIARHLSLQDNAIAQLYCLNTGLNTYCTDTTPPIGMPIPLSAVVTQPFAVISNNCLTILEPGSYQLEINGSFSIAPRHSLVNIKCVDSSAQYNFYFNNRNLQTVSMASGNLESDFETEECTSQIEGNITNVNYTNTLSFVITPSDISNSNNIFCFYFQGELQQANNCPPCEESWSSGTRVFAFGSLFLKLCKVSQQLLPPAEGPNWFGSSSYADRRDKFFDACLNEKTCFSGWVFWANFCISLWRSVICIKDNAILLEIPCDFQKRNFQQEDCNDLFKYLRVGYSPEYTNSINQVSFCSQPLKLTGNCDSLLIKFHNEDETPKIVRVEGKIEKMGYTKNQEVSYSSKGINRKLYAAASQEWILETAYYTTRFHEMMIRALECDYFAAEINGEWVRFICEDSYTIEWDEEVEKEKRGKGTVKLKSYVREIFNDFCVE